jgi:hypothetical protein
MSNNAFLVLLKNVVSESYLTLITSQAGSVLFRSRIILSLDEGFALLLTIKIEINVVIVHGSNKVHVLGMIILKLSTLCLRRIYLKRIHSAVIFLCVKHWNSNTFKLEPNCF